jgi:hypothetical protein
MVSMGRPVGGKEKKGVKKRETNSGEKKGKKKAKR